MHIPDGFLDAPSAAVTAGLAVAGLAVALTHARRTLPPRNVPLLGLSAAFIFAAQMVNFPVAGGTSGHLMGSVLVAVLLGPSAAVIVMATVLIVQCFAFADGGITALGANIFNMGIVGGVGGWLVFATVTRLMAGLKGRIVASVVASWISVVAASALCAGELAASGRVSAGIVFPAMIGFHMIIGLGEAVITALVLISIASVRPELVLAPAAAGDSPAPARSLLPVLGYGVLVAVGVGAFVSPFASSSPDGLERVAEDKGFIDFEKERAMAAPLPDYQWPRLSNGALATGIAGGVGTLAVFGLGLLLARGVTARKVG